MKPGSVAIVGASETTRLGVVPEMSVFQLHADAALNAMADAGLRPSDIDGVASGLEQPGHLAHYLGITTRWIDGTLAGGCSWMLHVRHAVAAIEAGLCTTVLVVHGESGRSRVGSPAITRNMASLMGQFEMPYGINGPATTLPIPVLRYMKTYGISREHLAQVAVVQREWAAMNPRATYRDPLTIEAVLASKVIAWPLNILMCCLVTDGGGALILTTAERARDFRARPVYVMGAGESSETPNMISQMEDFNGPASYRRAGGAAFESAGITPGDVDHLMAYDAFAHLPLYTLEALGFCKPGEAKDFVWDRNTAPGGRLPMNTSGGGLSYMHSGHYGMYALQESVRQLRGTAPAQVADAKISVAHGIGNMHGASATVILTNQD